MSQPDLSVSEMKRQLGRNITWNAPICDEYDYSRSVLIDRLSQCSEHCRLVRVALIWQTNLSGRLLMNAQELKILVMGKMAQQTVMEW